MAGLIAKALVMMALAGASTGDKDIVLRAMDDEMLRSQDTLRLQDHPKPFYIDYRVRDFDNYGSAASFGALTNRTCRHWRTLKTHVLVGDYKLNSSKEVDFSYMGSARILGQFMAGSSGAPLPIDDDYFALRRAIWRETDQKYKDAIESLAAKNAYLVANKVSERPDDLSKEEPVVSIGPTGTLNLDRAQWDETVKRLSGIFRNYSHVRRSTVGFFTGVENSWFVNSEGSKNRTTQPTCAIVMLAIASRADGSKAADCDFITRDSIAQMPSPAELQKHTEEFAERLEKLRTAKSASEDYDGPVLLEGQAAAEFLAQTLAPLLGNSQERGSFGPAKNIWREKLGQKILPTFISIIDDPSAKEYRGSPIYGTTNLDDDGLKAEKLTLVDHGILKTFCMSRIPTRQLTKSNGHSLGGVGTPTTLILETDHPQPLKDLKASLIAEGKEQGLKYVYIIRRMTNMISAASAGSMSSLMHSGGDLAASPPLCAYQVSTADGHEELIRDVSFGHLGTRVFRDIEACADDSKPYPLILMAKNFVTPSILIKEVEIEKRQGKPTSNEPILENPFFSTHPKI